MPSQDEIDQHQQDVEELSTLAVAAVTAVVLASSGDEDHRSLVKSIVAAMEPYLVAAGQLAVDWYRRLARTRSDTSRPGPAPVSPASILGPTDRMALLDAADFVPRPAALPAPEQLESTVEWALGAPDPVAAPAVVGEPAVSPPAPTEPAPTEPLRRRASDTTPANATSTPAEPLPRARVVAPAEGAPGARVVPAAPGEQQARVVPASPEQQAVVLARLEGATQRYVTSAARDTITENADREGVRWVRHAQSDACAFCRMLASRGPEYLTQESADVVVGRRGRPRGKRKLGEQYHDFCQCEPVAVRAGDSYTPPDYAADWELQYFKAVAEVGNSGNTKAILAAMRAAERERGGSTR
ncbi:hypothetical protein [Nocardia sp. NPDC049149]|uniref:VG15 protein n=1 Tax=Nocardia sp. NPDC049149 TaxID=3364315 RepID=UPI0037142043